MYELPIQVEAFGISPDGHHICAVGMRQHSDPILEISVLKIPDKVLTTNSTLEGYLNGRDFSVQAGVRKPITENEQDELKIKSVSTFFLFHLLSAQRDETKNILQLQALCWEFFSPRLSSYKCWQTLLYKSITSKLFTNVTLFLTDFFRQ